MESENNKKIISMAFVIMGVCSALVVEVLLDSLSATFGVVARFRSNDIVSHGLPVMMGLLTFLTLQFNRKIQIWADEAVSEVKKVVWPSRRDTTAMTLVTCVMLLISGVLIGTFDFVARNLIKMILN